MKLINLPYKIGCQICNNMSSWLTVKNNKLICLRCANKKYLNHDDRKPHTLSEIRQIYKRFKRYSPGRKIYAVKGVTSICRG